jgi:hypothetical protein
MIERCFIAIITSVLLASCSSKEPTHGGNYKVLSARPTTRDWKAAVWTFVATKKSGSTERFTFRVTDEIAETCTSGTWRKLEVVGGRIPQFSGGRSQPAFSIEGSFLWISLLAPWCDIDDDIRGRLAGETFTGDRTRGGMMGSDLVGTVRGWCVK